MMLGLRSLRTAALAAALVAPLALNNAPAIAQSGADGVWEQILREKGVSRNATYNCRVERVAERILKAADQNPREWQFAVIEDETPNAFALPDGHIGVHTGLFKIAKTDDELAAVIGHEVAHVTQEHGRERCRSIGEGADRVAHAMQVLGDERARARLVLDEHDAAWRSGIVDREHLLHSPSEGPTAPYSPATSADSTEESYLPGAAKHCFTNS